MLSYMLPTEDKPPPGNVSQSYQINRIQAQNRAQIKNPSPKKSLTTSGMMITTFSSQINDSDKILASVASVNNENQNGGLGESPKHNGTARKSTLHTSRVVKDESLYSIGSDASTVGSEKKHKLINGGKHASLKRVSFGSSKGSMVETLVFETPVQEEPETNHFLDHNGRLPTPMAPVPDTDEGRERVRVSLLEPAPSPATPGVLLLEPTAADLILIDAMATSPAELLTTHTDHTTPTYHTQISTDSGWDNPFRPDGDLSREADEIVELIKGGKPITPTPGQNAPQLPGTEATTPANEQLDTSASPLLKSSAANMQQSSPPRPNQGNGNAHSTPIKSGNQTANNQQPATEKVGGPAMVEVSRVTAQGPGDASQVEHVTLKKKPKCKCCVLQ